MSDILFKTEDYVFSYRVAGICIQNGKLLLQKPADDEGYAFPGGHCAFGETSEETLIREFREETGAEISVGELKWVGEIFSPGEAGPATSSACTIRSTSSPGTFRKAAPSGQRKAWRGEILTWILPGFRLKK